MAVATYAVSGMSCGVCSGAVSAEITDLPGVTSVRVDLAAGRVTVTAAGEIDDAAVCAAVAEAGYEVAAE